MACCFRPAPEPPLAPAPRPAALKAVSSATGTAAPLKGESGRATPATGPPTHTSPRPTDATPPSATHRASAEGGGGMRGGNTVPVANGKEQPPVSATSGVDMTQNSGQQAISSSAMPPWYSGSRDPGSHSDFLGTNIAPMENMASINDILRLNLGEVKLVLQKLAGVNNTPMIALNEACELLCKHLSVSFCSITGFTDHCTSYVLLAAYGEGAAEVEKTPVMRGAQWSCAKLLEQPTCLHCKAGDGPDPAADMPDDFKILVAAGGIRSFLTIPIATEHEVLGALTIGKEDADGFDVDWWEPMLGCLSMGLLGPLRSEQTAVLCQLMKALDTSPDYVTLIHQLLRGAFSLLLRATNIRTGCRLALLSSALNKALVFEPDRKQLGVIEAELGAVRPGVSLPPGAPGGMLGASPDPQIHVTEIGLDNTLLLDAVQKGKARFVSDCASYIQSCMKPATDIFISGQEMVASIVVLPLMYEGTTFGGFYVTLETTSNFQKIKDLLMGFVNSIVLVLFKRLQPLRDQIWTSLTQRTPVEERPAHPELEGNGRASGSQGASVGANVDPALSTTVTESGSGAKTVMMKRTCTEAMLKVLQHEIRKTHAKSQAHEWIEELSLSEIVGKGGFGVVYKGSWKGSTAAVKVMYARQHERQAMKDALEMAVLTTVSHPNIIQVYNCFTDMVEDASGSNAPLLEGRINIRFRRLQPDEDPSLATCNILVMEYCDRASLRHAMKKGVFHKRLGSTSVAVDLCAIVQVLVEVAHAIQHLHKMKLIHCDIKPENVLLKSDPSKPISFVTKLSDFGLAKLLRDNYYIVNRSGSGTVTHLAPELFQVGSKLTTAVDTFSFGIMMWELYTGQRAYGGLGREAIIDRVYKKKARPIFPLGVPPAYAALAKSCWDNDPLQRPAFTVVLMKLGEMLAAFTQANTGLPPPAQQPAPAASGPSPAQVPAYGPSGGPQSSAAQPTALSQQQQQQQQPGANGGAGTGATADAPPNVVPTPHGQ